MMKKNLLFISVYLFVTSAFAVPGYNNSQFDLNEAIQGDEKVLLVFGASWCSPCKTMIEDVWSVQEFKNFVDDLGVKKFYFDTDQHSALSSQWNVTTIPTWFTLQGSTTVQQNGSMTIRGAERVISESFPSR